MKNCNFFLNCLLSFALSVFIVMPAFAAPGSVGIDAKTVVPEIIALGLKPEVKKVTTKKLEKLSEKEDEYYLQIQIGKVSADQFNKLKALYGNLSVVKYDANKSYDMIDFLPPAIQATVNSYFVPKAYNTIKRYDWPTEGEDYESLWGIRKNGVGYFTNCWATTIEVLKFLNTKNPPVNNLYTISWPGRWETDELMKNDEFSRTVEEKDTQFGDALLVWLSSKLDGAEESLMLQHTALVVNSNLVFEKTDSSANDMYRLSLKKDVLSKYRRIFEGDGRFSYRRFGGDKKPLETKIPKEDYNAHQKEILLTLNPTLPVDRLTFGCETGLGGGCDPVISEYDQVQIVINPETGRGMMAGKKHTLRRFLKGAPQAPCQKSGPLQKTPCVR